jgi:hypothetical protein
MPFHVVNTQYRNAQRETQGMGHGTTHHQRPDQPGAGGIGYPLKIVTIPAGLGQYLVTQRQQFANMVTGRQLRHHPAIIRMHGNLAEQRVGQQALLGVIQGNAGFVTGGFNTKNQHSLGRVRNGNVELAAF